MKNRRDVVYFGVDEYDDPLLTYYDCKDGYCKEIYDLKCTRTCDAHQFDFSRANFALLQVFIRKVNHVKIIMFQGRTNPDVSM